MHFVSNTVEQGLIVFNDNGLKTQHVSNTVRRGPMPMTFDGLKIQHVLIVMDNVKIDGVWPWTEQTITDPRSKSTQSHASCI